MPNYHCRRISIWCGVATEVCGKSGEASFFLSFFCFYGQTVQKLQAFPFSPYSRCKQDRKMRFGLCFNESAVFYLALSSGFEIIKIKTCQLSFLFSSWSILSLHRGFKFRSCVKAVSIRCKTSRDALKSHCLSSAIDFRMLLVMKGSGILMHPEFLFWIMTDIDYIGPHKERTNFIRKF